MSTVGGMQGGTPKHEAVPAPCRALILPASRVQLLCQGGHHLAKPLKAGPLAGPPDADCTAGLHSDKSQHRPHQVLVAHLVSHPHDGRPVGHRMKVSHSAGKAICPGGIIAAVARAWHRRTGPATGWQGCEPYRCPQHPLAQVAAQGPPGRLPRPSWCPRWACVTPVGAERCGL
jgi:hypothetical protein